MLRVRGFSTVVLSVTISSRDYSFVRMYEESVPGPPVVHPFQEGRPLSSPIGLVGWFASTSPRRYLTLSCRVYKSTRGKYLLSRTTPKGQNGSDNQ